MRSEPAPHSRGHGSKPNLRFEKILADEARFIKSWFDNPLLTGAVSPSSPALAHMMALAIDPQAHGPVIELGPGTGVITQALLDRGVEPGRLVLVEFDEKFCRLLARRFPGVRIVRGDAYDLGHTLGDTLDEPIAAIVSSLPLLNKPEHARHALLAHAFELMAPDGVFVQFTYSFVSPIPRKAPPIAFEAEASPRIWLNLPPARVWIYRRPGTNHRTRGRAERTVFRPLNSNEKQHRHFGARFESARLRVRAMIRDILALPKEQPLEPARALLRKLPDLDE